MIQIKNNRLKQITASYFSSIDKRIQSRLQDVELVRDALFSLNGKSVMDFSTLTKIPWGAGNHEQVIKDHYKSMNIDTSNEDVSKPLLAIILDYSLISKKIAYNLTWGLNIRTCPYCNRIWIDTVRNKKGGIIRPTLDHFYSQENYPLLGLSFYNLVPSCYYCNTYLKSVKDFSASTHVHPYIEGFEADAVFSFSFKGLKPDISHPSNFTVKIKKKPKITTDRKLRIFGDTRENIGNIPTFKLLKIYQTHTDLLGELYLKTDEVNPVYATSIKDFLKLLSTSKEEFYRYHFHNYYNEEDMNMRPLSKFTKDIILERVPELR